MLVLSRKAGEMIRVPQCGLVITLLEVRGERVRLGISAPPDVQVYRQEVWARLQANEAPPASGSVPGPLVRAPREPS